MIDATREFVTYQESHSHTIHLPSKGGHYNRANVVLVVEETSRTVDSVLATASKTWTATAYARDQFSRAANTRLRCRHSYHQTELLSVHPLYMCQTDESIEVRLVRHLLVYNSSL